MRLLFMIISLTALSIESTSQSLYADLNMEKTVAGNHFGMSLVMQAKSQWSIGGFYQIKLNQVSENVIAKDLFYGLTLFAPLVREEKINFYLNVRAGIVNSKFVVLVPGLETQLRITNRIFTGFGLGMRMGYPAISARIAYRFPNTLTRP